MAKDRSTGSLVETMGADPAGIRRLDDGTDDTGSSSRVRTSNAKVATDREENDRKS